MALLPRYQRIGLQVRQPQQMDFAAAREQARFAQTISEQVDRMSDFAFKEAAQAAELRGQERVREEGALPTLETLREAGGPTTIAERAAFDAANRIAVVEIESMAKQDMQNLLREADKNNMSMSAFQTSMADIQDGYAASLQEIDPVAGGVLSARLNDSALTYQGRYSDIAFRKAQAAAKERVANIVSIGSQEILDSATQPGATRESIEAAGAKLLADQLELGVKRENAQKVVDATLKQAVRQNRLYLYDNADSIDAKRLLLEEYEKNPLPGYTYEQNRSFMISLDNNLKSEVNRAQQQSLTDLNNAISVLTVTGQAPEGYEFNEDAIDSIFSPEEAANYKEAWNDANEDVLNRGALANMAPSRAQEITEELFAEIRTSDDPDRAIRRHADWVEAVANRNDAIRKDAALFVAQTDETAAGAIADIQAQITAGNIDAASQGILNLRDIVQGRFDDLGVPPNQRNVMPKQFAAQMVDVIQSIDTDVASQTFNQIRLNLGNYAPQFIEELRAQKLRPEYVQAMYTTNVAVQKELLDISTRDITEIKTGLEKTVVSDVQKEINTLLEDYRFAYLAGGGAQAEAIFNEQYAVIEKLALSRIKGTDVKMAAAVEGAVSDIIPEVDQVILNPQGKYVVPVEFDAAVIETNASRLLAEGRLRRLDIVPLDSAQYPGFVDEAVSLASIESTGVWLNNSTGDGLTLHYTVNDVELPVLRKDGSEFEVKFSEMSRLLSTIDEQIRTELPVLDAEPEEPIEKSELELQKDSLKKMLDTVPVEIQRATSLENRKLLNRYQEEASKGIVNDPDFFLSYDDWLKGQ
jgi:hypothetical protein